MSVDPTLQPGNGAHAQACEAILLSYGHEEFLTEGEISSPGVLRATINFCESAPEFALTCALAATTTAIQGNGARYSRRERRLFRQACARAASKCSSGSGVIKKNPVICSHG